MKQFFIVLMLMLPFMPLQAKKQKGNVVKSDREVWVEWAYKIAAPVLENMAKGELQKNMELELSPIWDNRDKRVAYMETFGRLMDGITPWLALPDDDTKEGQMRKQLREWALLAYKNAVDPNSPDMLLWGGREGQRLVDAAFLAESFLRAPEATWEKLDKVTQQRYVECFKLMRSIRPAYSNWLLFRGIVECFLIMAGEQPDMLAIPIVANKINEWYVGDGWYSDGPEFAIDYYNAFVIQPMFVELLETMESHRMRGPISAELAVKRMQRYNVFIERLISPEGTFPAFGRSIVYRMGAFQTLAMAAWKYGLPENLTNGGVRSALTKVMNNMFNVEGNFNAGGYLTLGFAGHQTGLANSYSNNGSAYLTSFVFLPLGLPADHPFWTDPAQPWTQLKAWSGQAFPIDGHVSLRYSR